MAHLKDAQTFGLMRHIAVELEFLNACILFKK